MLLILVMRQWDTFTLPYLISEDGPVFIDRAINRGFSALFMTYVGYYHFIPQFLTSIFYSICKAANNVTLLPYLMGTSSILIAALVVSYFLNERFAWVLEKRKDRLIVC